MKPQVDGHTAIITDSGIISSVNMHSSILTRHLQEYGSIKEERIEFSDHSYYEAFVDVRRYHGCREVRVSRAGRSRCVVNLGSQLYSNKKGKLPSPSFSK